MSERKTATDGKAVAASESNVTSHLGPELEAALLALRSYDAGSSRGALIPIDEAAMAATRDPVIQRELETRLSDALGAGLPAVAGEYVCRKLAMVGTGRCVPALAKLLRGDALFEASRTALEAITDEAAVDALRRAARDVQATHLIGLVHSLGARRDIRAVGWLARLSRNADRGIQAAAVAALGSIGTPSAARALRRLLAEAPARLPQGVADACLTCAEHLKRSGRADEATPLVEALTRLDLPAYQREAAARQLRGG